MTSTTTSCHPSMNPRVRRCSNKEDTQHNKHLTNMRNVVFFLLASLVSLALPTSAQSRAHYGYSPGLGRVPRRHGRYSRSRRRGHDTSLVEATAITKKARPYKYRRHDERPNEGQVSWVSRLTMINILVFGLQMWKPNVTRWGIKLSDRIRNGEELYRLITPAFLHSGVTHLASNTFSLQRMGPDVERFFGPGRFLATYLAAGVAGNYLSAIKSPNPSLGASGAVFGVYGAYLAFMGRHEVSTREKSSPRRRTTSHFLSLCSTLQFLFGRRGEMAMSRVTEMVGMNLVLGFMTPQIDNWAHLGGFLGGAAMSLLIGPNIKVVELPNGRGLLLDDPIIRTPAYLETIPRSISENAGNLSRRVRKLLTLPQGSRNNNKPWRRQSSRPNYYERRETPARSLRPNRDL